MRITPQHAKRIVGQQQDSIVNRPSSFATSLSRFSRGRVHFTRTYRRAATAPWRGEATMGTFLGVVLLIVGITAAAGLAIFVTRWALHMNEE